MDGQSTSERIGPAAWLAIVLVIIGAGFVFFAAHAPGAESVAATHGFVGFVVGIVAAILWLAEVRPGWLYFGVAFGCAASLIVPSHWLRGILGLLCLALARGLQVRFRL